MSQQKIFTMQITCFPMLRHAAPCLFPTAFPFHTPEVSTTCSHFHCASRYFLQLGSSSLSLGSDSMCIYDWLSPRVVWSSNAHFCHALQLMTMVGEGSICQGQAKMIWPLHSGFSSLQRFYLI
jgi:hypothetical protein